MEMVNVNVNVKDMSATLAEVRATIKELKDYKNMIILDSIPRGERNAKTASEMFDKADIGCLVNKFQDLYQKYITIGNEKVYRKFICKEKTFVNVDNPNEVRVEKSQVYVYWRD